MQILFTTELLGTTALGSFIFLELIATFLPSY